MDKTVELTGIARFSPRMWLLRRYTRSEDPILSTTATSLIRDTISRRLGLAYELIFVILGPIGALLGIEFTVIWLNQLRASHATIGLPAMLLLRLLELGILFIIPGMLIGMILLVRPGVILINRQEDGSGLKLLSIRSTEIVWNLCLLHVISFIYPAAFYCLAIASLGAQHYTGLQTWFGWRFVWHSHVQAVVIVWTMMSICYTVVASIWPSLTFRNTWSAVLGLLGMCVLYVLLVILPFIPPIVGVWLAFALAAYLAYKAAEARVMPSK